MIYTICSLQKDKAIEIISKEKDVFFKRGVWNPLRKVSVTEAIKGIRASNWGADVRLDTETGKYQVSCPVDSDMW